jgi:nucleoside-diphosphate-sugar epimerase
MKNPPNGDLEHVLAHTDTLWPALGGGRLFITGGTGFFGRWLLESFLWANDRLKLKARAVVLSRNPDAFAARAPRIACHRAIELLQGDVRRFEAPAGEFSHIIHAATDTVSKPGDDPLETLDTIVAGTRRMLEFAAGCGAQRLLFTSSGAVYGTQPPELAHVPEDYAGGSDDDEPFAAYAEGKRVAERLCAVYGEWTGIHTSIARCFAFVGPYLPLDAHFAIGNFIRDGLAGGPIRVHGDGTPYRSYLYAADLAIWLWTILLRGEAGRVYNVGADRALPIRELAEIVARQFDPAPEVHVARRAAGGEPPARYVPDISRARKELGLEVRVGLEDAVQRTIRWHETPET